MGAAMAFNHFAAMEVRFTPRSFRHLWLGRIRFRRDLFRLLRDKPQLIADMGLTIEQAKQEISKRFWQRCCMERT